MGRGGVGVEIWDRYVVEARLGVGAKIQDQCGVRGRSGTRVGAESRHRCGTRGRSEAGVGTEIRDRCGVRGRSEMGGRGGDTGTVGFLGGKDGVPETCTT